MSIKYIVTAAWRFGVIFHLVSQSMAQQVTGFTLINAATDGVIRPISNGDKIILSEVGNQLNIRADTSGPVGSVRFDFDGVQNYWTDIIFPFALGRNLFGNYASVANLAVAGSHTVSATPFSAFYRGRTSGTTLTIRFDVIAVAPTPPPNTATTDVPTYGHGPTGDVVTVTPTPPLNTVTPTPPLSTAPTDVPPYGNGPKSDVITVTPTPPPNTDTPTPPLSTAPTGVPPYGNGPTGDVITVTPTPPPNTAPTDVTPYGHGPTGVLTGELRKWHKITVGFTGPATSEIAEPNPFTYYRLDVTFSHAVSSKTYRVPGYFAADGNAANSGALSGNVWIVHFCPDEEGEWTYIASFFKGTNVAQNGGGTAAGFFHGAAGTFSVAPTNKTGRDHRGKGRLRYVGKHHLQFAENSEWFLKAGADSPENFLAYEEFDNTPNYGNRRKSWIPHQIDYRNGNPTWAGGRGSEIIGAINYLSAKGMNAISFLSMNIGGDDKNVFPYISDTAGGDRQRIDISKTAQWEIVFEHADHVGLYLHFTTQETENDQLLDGGSLGLERKLYYRELIARFSHHLALNWNLGEENTNTDPQRKQFCDFFEQVDPYGHLVVVHTPVNALDMVYKPLLGYPTFDGASLQIADKSKVFSETLKWVQLSSAAGRKWVVANDEQGDYKTGVAPDANDPAHDVVRKNVLWGNIMAGGAGVEYYFGYSYPNSDLTCNDYRSRAAMWDQSRHALGFFRANKILFWEMSSRNDLVSADWCLAKPGEVYVVYIKNAVTADIDLAVSGSYTVKWFDPIVGGNLQNGSILLISGGNNNVSLGNAPDNVIHDWAILIRKGPTQPIPPT